VLRFLLWRLLGLLAIVAGLALVAWFIDGGPGKLLRGDTAAGFVHTSASELAGTLARWARTIWSWAPPPGVAPARALLALTFALVLLIAIARTRARSRRRYVRLRVEAYRADDASVQDVATMFAALHKRLLARWWRRLLHGQPSLSLEVHHSAGAPHLAWLAIACPQGLERMVEASLQATYPNCRLRTAQAHVGVAPTVLRLKKHAEFIKRVKALEDFERRPEPPVNRLLTTMAACGEPAFVQIAMTPAPAMFEALAKRLYKHHEARLSRERREHLVVRDRSMVGTQELSDLRPPGAERLLEQVLGNLSVLIAHRQVVPGSAELIASVAGRRGAWKVSRHSEGRTTRMRTSVPVLDPDRVMTLGRGWAAVLVLGDGARARVTRMFSPARGR
jgi:hypothetical protein